MRFTRDRIICCACLGLLWFAQPLKAENWPQWRGAKLDGISHETDLPQQWSKTENVA